MEAKPDEAGSDNGSRPRKFGLPDWMVNNIERLNFVSDFDQYSSSPPDSDGFFSEYKEGQDISFKSETSSSESKSIQEVKLPKVVKAGVESDSRPTKLILNPPDLLPSIHTPLNVKSEELFSSPDSTPCATPEPSPVVRRKMSNPGDTVITNPGRWFYLGKINKPKHIKGISSNLNNKENKVARDELSSVSVKPSDSILNSEKHGIKLMISNFDLNAVSPTSW